MKNLGGDINGYEVVKQMKLYDIIGYIDILEKQDRYDKIVEQDEKISNIETQFGQKPPKKFDL